MACLELEELLNEGSGGHAAHCEECRALLDALAHADATFDAAFSHVSAPQGLAANVRVRVVQLLPECNPSPVPELLDLIGWAAILVIAAVVVPRFATLLSSVLTGLG